MVTVKKIKKNDKWDFEIPYVLYLNYYIIEAFVKQYMFRCEIFQRLIWIEFMITENYSMIKLGIWKLFIQFGPGIEYE
jgi:hypothetical protein